jgi:hypothetical protein
MLNDQGKTTVYLPVDLILIIPNRVCGLDPAVRQCKLDNNNNNNNNNNNKSIGLEIYATEK